MNDTNEPAQVRAYYDRLAVQYEAECTSGVLGNLRRREHAAIVDLLRPSSGDRVLDAGCGSGHHAVHLQNVGCVVTGMDISPRMVAEARARGIDAHVGDLVDFDLTRRFQKILCAGPLEFCVDHHRVIGNLTRHLEPDGVLVLLFPLTTLAGRAYRLFHRAHGIRVALFSVRDIQNLFEVHGLVPHGIRHPTPLSCAIAARHA